MPEQVRLVREQIAQALRVKEQAEQTLRVSMTTEILVLSRSAQLYMTNCSTLFHRTPAQSDAVCKQSGLLNVVRLRKDVVQPQEEMNRTAEPKAFDVSAY